VPIVAIPNYKPTRLRIQVTGVGRNNALKNMEMVVNRYTLSYPVNATVTMPNGSGNPINFDLGGSNVTSASGNDAYGTAPPVAAFAVANSDYNATNNIIDGCTRTAATAAEVPQTYHRPTRWC
jgi:hypothetical protein